MYTKHRKGMHGNSPQPRSIAVPEHAWKRLPSLGRSLCTNLGKTSPGTSPLADGTDAPIGKLSRIPTLHGPSMLARTAKQQAA